MLLSLRRYRADLSVIAKALAREEEKRKNDVSLFIPATNVVFLPLILLWLIFLIFFVTTEAIGRSAGGLGDSFNVLNSLLSGLALGAIALSLFLQRADLKATLKQMEETNSTLEKQVGYLKFERDRNVREFAATFESERLKKARSLAYILRPAFFQSREFRRMLADQWISREDVSFSDEWMDFIADANRGRISEIELANIESHTWHISDLVEYYSTLYHHCESLGEEDQGKVAKLLGEKYLWSYWRGMLLLLGYESANLYDEIVTTEKERGQFPKPHWIHDLVAFDRWVMSDRYHPMVHPREKPYSEGPIEFDYEYLSEFVGLSRH